MILERPKLVAQQRLDLEDMNTLLSSALTSSRYWTKQFISTQNQIVKGFQVSGIGLKEATIAMTDSTLVFSQNTSDFSWFTSEDGASDIIIPDVDLQDSIRNYVEIYLTEVSGTPVTRAFWDPAANGGAGAEFNQQVDTVTTLNLAVSVIAGGFSGNPDRIPLAIIDVDPSGNIKSIIDKRPLYFRLGTPANANNSYTWASQIEPLVALSLTGGTGTYTVGETVTFSSGATATVVTGGTVAITVKSLSSDSFASGDTVLGGDSLASRTLDTIEHSFTGGDMGITTFKNMFDALATEIKAIKGTDFWYSVASTDIESIFVSLTNINAILDAPSYDETLAIAIDTAASSVLTMPVHSRSNPVGEIQYYTVGKGGLELYLNGQYLLLGSDWSEIGTAGTDSNTVTILVDLKAGDVVTFRIDAAGGPGLGGGTGTAAADDNFNTLAESIAADNNDFILIYDSSEGAYRKQKRSVLLTGVSGSSALRMISYIANHTANTAIEDVILVDANAGDVTIALPPVGSNTGVSFIVKKIDSTSNAMIVSGNGATIDGAASQSSTTQWTAFTVACDGSAWYIL